MSFDSSRFIFIVGHYKSGSTWLLNMLSLHPDVRGVQETHIFHHLRHAPDLHRCTQTLYTSVPWSGGGLGSFPRHCLVKHFGRFVGPGRPSLSLHVQDRPMTRLDLSLRDQRFLYKHLTSSSSAEQYCWRFFDFLWQRAQPSRYLLEKTPNNIRYIDDIVRLFPQGKLLAIYRDGRDVVVSDHSFRKYYKRSAACSLRQSTLRWREDMEAQFRICGKADLYAISYEDLIKNGRNALRNVLDFLQLRAGSDILDDMIERSSFRYRSGRQRGQEDPYSFLRKGIVGDWRNHLRPEDIQLFKELAGDVLIRLGYESSDDW